jgi:hypothetical protein
MKKPVSLLLFIFTLAIATLAQDDIISNKFSAGFHLSQYKDDFGFGLNLTSPYIAKNNLAFRLRGNIMFFEHIKDEETTWTPYSNLSIGIIGVGGKVGDFIRLYGEGGAILLFPSEEFSSESMVFGGYGLFGFEFYMNYSFNYFIEIGGIGSGATADKIDNKPIYSNGLSISTGFRAHF